MMESSTFHSGKYTQEEINKIFSLNQRPQITLKPFNAFYKKSAGELGPTWAERKEVNYYSREYCVY